MSRTYRLAGLALVAALIGSAPLAFHTRSETPKPHKEYGASKGPSAKLSRLPSTVSYDTRPLAFEPNVGQSDARVKFVSHGAGYGLFLTQDKAVFALQKGSASNRFSGTGLSSLAHSHPSEAATVRMSFIGANARPTVEALDELPGKSAYLIGNDPKKWRHDVSTYGRVRYRNVYPGIDLVYYGDQRHVEFDFVVAAGADPRTVNFELTTETANARSYVDHYGDLVTQAQGAELRFHKPAVYQPAGASEKQFVDAKFVTTGNNRFGFAVSAYDHTRPLVIDPATYLGGTADDQIQAIALSSAGVYVAGFTASNDFPGTTSRSGSQRTDTDAFVALLSADLKTLIQATYMGGTQDISGSGVAYDQANAIAVSTAGVYIAGQTSSGDFPGLIGGAQPYNAGGPSDGFVALLSPDLKTLIQSTCLGHVGDDRIYAIAVTAGLVGGGNPVPQYSVFVAGYTNSKFFPSSAGGAEPISNVGVYDDNSNTTRGDGFLAAFSADLKTLDQSTFLGGSEFDAAYAIAVPPPGGFVYVAGVTDSGGTTNANGFPDVLGGAQPENGGGPSNQDGFVALLTSDLAGFLGATYLGGNEQDQINAIAVDTENNNVYVAGYTNSTDFPGTPSSKPYPGQGSAQGSYAGNNCSPPGVYCLSFDAFVTLLNSSLTAIQNSTYLGGSGDDNAYALAALPNHVYVAGRTTSGQPGTTPFPHTQGGLQPTYMGGSGIGDAFLAEISPDLTSFRQATYLGGPFDDEALAIATAPGRSGPFQVTDVYVAGWTNSYTFVPATTDGAQPNPSRFDDGFVAELFLDSVFVLGNVAVIEQPLTAYVSTNVTVSSLNSFASSVGFSVLAPSGFTVSVNPASVQPPVGGSASTTLNITLGPSVTPGAYTLEVKGTSGQFTDSIPVTVNVRATPASMMQVVGELQGAACIDNSGVASALNDKLTTAQTEIAAGDVVDASGTLNALLNQLGSQAGKHIHTSCTYSGVSFNADAVLVADTQALLASL
jgi:beta-propeller repeat-containing protein